MSNKKIAGFFLFLFCQMSGMFLISRKSDPKQSSKIADISRKKIPFSEPKNGQLNNPFCFNSDRDILTIIIMSNLDYTSNIRFITTCKDLYKKYGHGENSKFLFTHYVNSSDYKRVINCFDNTQSFYEIIEKDNILERHVMILAANPICLQYLLKQGLSPNSRSDNDEPRATSLKS